MGAAAAIDPPEQITACSYCVNGICKRPMKLWRLEVLHELGQLTDADLEAQKIFLCRECDGDVFSRECDLNAHVKKHHYTYCNNTNLEIVHDCIYGEDCGPSPLGGRTTFPPRLQLGCPTLQGYYDNKNQPSSALQKCSSGHHRQCPPRGPSETTNHYSEESTNYDDLAGTAMIAGRLNCGKAAGLYGDSLDLYVKCARSIDLSKDVDKQKATRLAAFFSLVANGDVPTKFQRVLRTTYLGALEKDPGDKLKLRPLGVASAIRRITTAAILLEYSSVLAENLSPLNFAVSVSGGCNLVVKTMQLGVDKYISEPELAGRPRLDHWCP
eukprot:scaffold56674_cov56-Cyclotella_meneghiniana.AAC.3